MYLTTRSEKDLKQMCCSAEGSRLLAQHLCNMDVIMPLQLGRWQLYKTMLQWHYAGFVWLSVSKRSRHS